MFENLDDKGDGQLPHGLVDARAGVGGQHLGVDARQVALVVAEEGLVLGAALAEQGLDELGHGHARERVGVDDERREQRDDEHLADGVAAERRRLAQLGPADREVDEELAPQALKAEFSCLFWGVFKIGGSAKKVNS